jgi:hypothetical protein
MVSRRVAATVTGIRVIFGKPPKRAKRQVGNTQTLNVAGRCSDCGEQGSNKTNKQITKRRKTNMPPTNEPTLTTALQAAQARISVTASTNPIGLSESLTRPNQSSEPRDLNAELITEIEALSEGLDAFEKTSGQPNPDLISAVAEVNDLKLKLDQAQKKLDAIQALGTPLDRLQRATVQAEHRLTKLISEYTKIVTAELLVERFGQEVAIQNLPPATKQELRLHKRLEVLRHFEPLRTSSETNANTELRLQQRADVAGERLTALRAHIAKEREENAKS